MKNLLSKSEAFSKQAESPVSSVVTTYTATYMFKNVVAFRTLLTCDEQGHTKRLSWVITDWKQQVFTLDGKANFVSFDKSVLVFTMSAGTDIKQVLTDYEQNNLH